MQRPRPLYVLSASTTCYARTTLAFRFAPLVFALLMLVTLRENVRDLSNELWMLVVDSAWNRKVRPPHVVHEIEESQRLSHLGGLALNEALHLLMKRQPPVGHA